MQSHEHFHTPPPLKDHSHTMHVAGRVHQIERSRGVNVTRPWWRLVLVISGWAGLADGAAHAQTMVSVHKSAHVRRPVAAAIIDEGRSLCVANQRSGTITVVDLEKREVAAEYEVGGRLSDVVAWGADDRLLITDESAHELLVVNLAKQGIKVVQRLSTTRWPVNVAVNEDESLISVAGLWSHRVSLLDANEAGQLTLRKTIRLPFAVRKQTFLRDGSNRLVVADAFGGNLAIIEGDQSVIASIRKLPAHNLRGLATTENGDGLLIAHQVLNPLARADYNDVIWGNLMQNVVRELPVESLTGKESEWLNASPVIRLGEAGDGAADPAGITVLPHGKGTLIALAGVDEIVVHTEQTSDRMHVGDRPVEIVWDERREVAYAVCALEDSVDVVDLEAGEVVHCISLGPLPVETPRDRGEKLFYDGHQSLDGWLSCHSCHPEGHTNHGLADTLGDNTFETPKKVPSLLGVRDANPWAWNGKFRELHEQVHSSFIGTMRGEGVDVDELNDVVAFLHTLEPPPAVDEGQWTNEDLTRIEQGRQLFHEIGCKQCHVPPLTYTLDTTFDVGLQDEAGLKKFNPPSLRGVSQRQSFFHDGRAKTLEAVFREHGHQVNGGLTDVQFESLMMFLRSL